MTHTDLIDKSQGSLRKSKPQLPDELIEGLIRSLEHTHEEECTCDDVYILMDQYADAEFHGEDVARLMPLIKQHMELCHNCNEEYEALLDILEKSNPS
jgi:hypothetical protein